MKRHFRMVALAAALLGASGLAYAQGGGTGSGGSGTGSSGSGSGASGTSVGPGTSSSGTAGGTGAGATGSSSPGTSDQNSSLTGVREPSTAPVDPRTHEPAQPGTALTPGERSDEGTGAGSTDYSTGSSATPQESMEGHLGNKAPSSKLQSGLAKLHAANLAEIQGGRTAEQSASSPDVKAFAQKMVTDHTQADQQLVAMSGSRVDLSSKAYKSAQKDAAKTTRSYQGRTGSAFDEAYISAMVKDHEKDSADVSKLAAEARKEGRNDWAQYLDGVEQTMQGHLAQARQIQSSLPTASSSSSEQPSSGTGASGDTGSNPSSPSSE